MPDAEKGSMSICWGPKVHQTRFWEPSFRSTVSTGASALRVRISASCFLVGLPVACTLCRMHRAGTAQQLPGVSQQLQPTGGIRTSQQL